MLANTRVLDFRSFQDMLHEENLINFVPHEAILWAKESDEHRHMKRISAYMDDNSPDSDQRVIIGLRVEYEQKEIE